MVLPEDDFLKDQAEQAVTSLSRLFTPLQGDALLLSKELLRFVEELGPEPPPRYTAKQIEQMPSAQVEALARAQDGDFSEACEYHSRDGAWFLPRAWQNAQGPQNEIMARWNRLYPWYQKVSSKYALELKDRVETLRHRLIVEGLDDDALSLPIEGRDGVSNVRKIAATLWELAYKAGEKGIGSKNA